MSDRGPAIEVRDLTVRFSGRAAVDALSFTVDRGELVALLGPNGAGKTTTVETLEGFRRPDAGQVRVLGLDPISDHRLLARSIGVMLQRGGVYTAMRPPEALRLFASYYDEAEDPEELFTLVGLDRQRRTAWRHLSGGEQQRLSLALALVGRPDVLFLDEPTAGIDPSGRQVIREVVLDRRRRGDAVLLTTHDLDEAERLADRVVIIDQGAVLAEGTPEELRALGGPGSLRFSAGRGIDVDALGAAIGRPVTETSPGEYQVDGPADGRLTAAVTGWLADQDIALGDLRAGRQRLEDVFLRLVEEASDAEPAHGPVGEPGGRRRARR